MLNDPSLTSTSVVISNREKDDTYGRVVAVLNPEWRVIECKDRVQWIIQRRDRSNETIDKQAETLATVRWRGLKYHRSRETLLTALARLTIEVSSSAMTKLVALPDWIHQTVGSLP